MYDVVIKKLTFDISSPDEFLLVCCYFSQQGSLPYDFVSLSDPGLASSFLHLPPDSRRKGRRSLYDGSQTPVPQYCVHLFTCLWYSYDLFIYLEFML